jgi:hypothetical protein
MMKEKGEEFFYLLKICKLDFIKLGTLGVMAGMGEEGTGDTDSSSG